MDKTEKIKEITAWLNELTDEEVEKIFKPAIKPFIKKELQRIYVIGLFLGCLLGMGIMGLITILTM